MGLEKEMIFGGEGGPGIYFFQCNGIKDWTPVRPTASEHDLIISRH